MNRNNSVPLPIFTLICVLFSAASVAAPQVENTAEFSAIELLRNTMSNELTKYDAFKSNTRLEYTREKTDSDKETESYRFLPKDLTQGRWNKVDTSYSQKDHDNKVWESDILFNPESFEQDSAKLIKQSPTHWFFEMAAKVGISVDSESSDAQDELKGVFRATVNIAKDSKQIDSYTIYSVKKFSPSTAVSVKTYSSYNELVRLRKDGPLVITLSKETVAGSAGFFFSIDDETTIKNFKFVEHKFSR